MMRRSLQKAAVATMLIFTSLLQGWPLLVAATCSMPEPQMMSQGGNCCCCESSPSSPSPAVASCNPGKSLVGILATDSSLLPGKDKTDKSLSQPLTVAPAINLTPPIAPAFLSFRADESLLPHTSATPLYLFECTFRI
jgi:hypothetical protein